MKRISNFVSLPYGIKDTHILCLLIHFQFFSKNKKAEVESDLVESILIQYHTQ